MRANAIRGGLAAILAALVLTAGAATKDTGPTAAAAQQVPPAVEAALRRNITERLPGAGRIDEVSRTPVAGIYEIRIGTDLFYSDAEGNYLLNGQLIDLRARRNLTEDRLEKLLAISFDALPLKDAFVLVRGNGKRKLAVFEDPNCSYCKRFERDLQKIENVTVYLFLYPILGPDSTEKSRNIWCAKDRGKAWLDQMIRNEAAPRRDANCDVQALDRNLEFGRKHRITGTPTIIFADGSRVPGAIGAADIEKMLTAASK